MISVAREAPAPHNNKAIETDSRHISGQRGEELALELLTSNRLEPVHRYYRCRVGELNLVMRDSELLVFIEVRYRKHIRFGGAAESVEARKRLRLTRAALMYCARESVLQKIACRFEVIALGLQSDAIDWYVDAFEVEG